MITSSNPYFRKIGLNLANLFFISINKNNKKYLDLFFKRNEREAIGRRLLIAIYVLEGYKLEQIEQHLKCGRQTVGGIKRDIENCKLNTAELLGDLREIYFSQFAKKELTGSSTTIAGAKRILGLRSEPTNPRQTKVTLP